VPLTNWRLLQSARLSRIVGRLAAQLDIQRPMRFLDRLPMVPAFNDELLGRFTGKVIAADLVADDQKALVHSSMSLDVVSTALPNVKIGEMVPQKFLDRLQALEAAPNARVENVLTDFEMQLAQKLVLSVRMRLNALACAMMIDTFSYDRFGVKLSGATWGMPSALKVTPGTSWATAATATPITDILSVVTTARQTYGVEFDKVTLSTTDFSDMTKTTQFANMATITLGAGFLMTQAGLIAGNLPEMQRVAGRMLNMTVELDDAVIQERNNAGTLTASRALPLHYVLLSRAQDEGRGEVMDFANGFVTESLVNGLTGAVDGLGGDQRGPVAYYTAPADLNPPQVTAWAVAKAFPRKSIPEATAVLVVG
jgi:hypothetical protein